ncbi:MAG: hypothetical protein R3214_10825 [Christiangramia sp.]|nr:hypothetical protein [Christiangramia sp.]
MWKKSVLEIVPRIQITKIHDLSFGKFFFLENIIISEVTEGISFDWSKGKQIIDLALQHYGQDSSVHYISNRIHDYSVRPQDWRKFGDFQKNLKTYSIITYGKIGYTNLIFEKIFFPSIIYHFTELEKALEFVGEYDKHLT